MRKNILLTGLLISTFLSFSQSNFGIITKDNWIESWTNFNPKKQEYKETNKTLAGTITENTTLSNRYTYLLHGVVYVTNNAVLTIEPGTVIRGDYETCGTLVITKGAKIEANGSPGFPIVFTTNKDTYTRRPGDWGGIIVMGDAPVNNFGGIGILKFDLNPQYNVYGGKNTESDSGVLNYVRIEYSGRKLSAKKELNGLSFAGVGNKTIIKNIQVSYCNDDSFEFYGGNVTLEKLISFRATDDDFDFTQGVQSKINNSIAIRNPYSSDFQGSRCFEIDSYDDYDRFDPNANKTKIQAENITLVNLEDNAQGLIKESIFLNKDSYLTFTNSIVYGFEDFLVVKNQLVTEEFEELVKLKNIIIAHCKNTFATQNERKIEDVENRYNLSKNNIKVVDGGINEFFRNIDVDGEPDFKFIKIEKSTENVVTK